MPIVVILADDEQLINILYLDIRQERILMAQGQKECLSFFFHNVILVL